MYNDLQLDALEAVRKKQYEKAKELYRQDLSENGNNVLSLRGLAYCEAELNNYDAADEILRFAAIMFPEDPDTFMMLGSIVSQLGDNDAAIKYTERANDLAVMSHAAMWNLGMFYMKAGRWREGWDLYEWGFTAGHRKPRTRQPALTPETDIVPGATVLLWGEQGTGDHLMFCRYIEDFAKKHPDVKIIYETRWDLAPMFMNYPHAQVYVKPENSSLPYDFDYHCSIASLPWVLGYGAPEPRKDYLKLDDAVMNYVSENIPFPKDKIKVGLCWMGSKFHPNDRNRSMTWDHISQLMRDDMTFYTLQPGETIPEIEGLINLNGDLGSWAITAAVLKNLDVLVTVDSAIAHMAGIMGVKTLVLHPKCVEWRWSGNWYFDMTHIAQKVRCDWSSVIEEAKEWLQTIQTGPLVQT